jgi:hypothetical protein
MDRGNTDENTQSLGLGVWLRAIVSGLIVMGGVVFICVILPFALQLGILGFAFFWILLCVGVLLGLVLGIVTARQTIRLARRELEREHVDREAGP